MFSACTCCPEFFLSFECFICLCVVWVSVLLVGWSMICCQGGCLKGFYIKVHCQKSNSHHSLNVLRLADTLGLWFPNLHRVAYPGGEASLRALKEEFSQMIFEKNLPWGTVLKFSHRRRQLLVEVRHGARTCDVPCILDYHCSSASLYPL